MNRKSLLKYLLSAAVAAALLYVSFRGIDWAEFLSGLKNCRWGWVVAAMCCGVLSFWFRALRWRELLLPIDPSIRRRVSFNAINIGLLVNLALPRVGEFVRCGFITRHSARTDVEDRASGSGKDSSVGVRLASYDKVLGTVVMERSLDVLTLLLLVAVVFCAMRDRIGAFLTEKILGPLSGRMDFSLWWILAGLAVTSALSLWGLWRLRRRNAVAAALFRFVSGIGQGLVSCMRMKRWRMFIVYTVAVWTMYWLMSLTILWAVQGMDVAALSPGLSCAVDRLAGLGASDALFLMLAGSLSSLVPVPGGFGAFHYIVAAALSSVYGVPFGVGIMFATLSHESQTITQVLCGGASYLAETCGK